MYLEYHTVVVLCKFFWLWREIVLKMRTRFYKKNYWVTLLWSDSRYVYIRPNTLLLCIFLFWIFLLYSTDLHVEVQIRILLKDKHRKSCQKCEHRQSHFDFLNNTYWVSLFVRNSLLIFWTGVSCFSVTLFYFTLFCCGGKFSLRPEKKDTLRPEKKDTIVIFVLVQLELNLIQIH